jgi:glutamine synthetase
MTDLVRFAAHRGIRHFLFSFCDLFGVQRAKLVPAAAVAELATSGAGFAGFAAWLAMSPADPDVLAFPDPRSLLVLPWQRQVAWVATDLRQQGKPLEQSPRLVLQRQLELAAQRGLQLRTGVEAEFFLLHPETHAIADARDQQSKPCYDQLALMRHYPLINELLAAMEELGWGPYQADHEDANGQFEINWCFADALTTADRHAFFRVMVAALAEKHGSRASFAPQAIPRSHRQRRPPAPVPVGWVGPQSVPRPQRPARAGPAGLSLPRRAAGACPSPVCPHQSRAGQLPAPGAHPHQLRRHLVPGLDQLRRQ